MIYKNFKDIKLSALGMGCMRLPVTEKEGGSVDKKAVEEMVSFAMENGINYFDTAWGYHDGESEKVMGEVLKKFPRESFYLATKFPGYDLNNMDKVKEIFEEQLRRCQTEYFDFYLFHNVSEGNIDAYLDPKFGILEYLLEQKKSGRIRHLGFSAHGTIETVRRFLDAYGEYMEFCQIQLNYMDWTMQNAKGKVEMLKEYSLPIWVMEPVRGGRLASLEEEYEKELRTIRPETSTVEWAFRFLQSIPEVTMTLSGMSDMTQLRENISTYQTKKPLSEEEKEKLLALAHKMISKNALPCTACRYCTSHCPKEINIPRQIELYNEHVYFGGGYHIRMAVKAMPDDKKPSACIGCRACEAVCPQNIKISEMMTDFSRRLKNKKWL